MGLATTVPAFRSSTRVSRFLLVYFRCLPTPADAPARLRRELDTVLNLQGDLENIDRAIKAIRANIVSNAGSPDSFAMLKSLDRTYERLKDKVEGLYTSLNVQESFPELRGIDLQFVRTLIMARDLKISIRKRAIGSFFEWERLDQAVAGRNQALGTKLHQHTRKAISKRKPALMAAIRKFNRYCETLESLHQPSWSIPIPRPLPTGLAALRNGSDLQEDVWITPSDGKLPRWLDDSDVRDGIRAMLKVDRCSEERQRLRIEADNLCRWFGRELAAVELALRTPSSRFSLLSSL